MKEWVNYGYFLVKVSENDIESVADDTEDVK